MRRIKRTTSLITMMIMITAATAFAANTDIRLNSLGFLPEKDKRASVAPQPAVTVTGFTVKRASDNSVAFTGTLTNTGLNTDTGEVIYKADFSALTEQGNFYLDVPQVGTSYNFPVSSHAYDGAFKAAMKAFYAWRCGTAVSWAYGGNTFQHAACHMNDGYMDYIDSTHTLVDGKGGWHDAGDYNKYVVNAGVTVGLLLFAWEHYKDKIETIPLGNPVTAGGYPGYLEEVKWETDWLLKMQASNGTVFHKLSGLSFCCDSKLPEYNTESRYYVPYSTAATADFTAMLAMAARNFAPYDVTYSNQLIAAARVSYGYLTTNPSNVYPSQAAFSTGGYTTTDTDDRLWAAVELWETTGEAVFHDDFKTKAAGFSPKVETNMDWSNIRNMGMITYLLSSRAGKDAALVSQIRTDLISSADSMVAARAGHGYGRPMGNAYWWGSNGHVARETLSLQVAYMLTGTPAYLNTALDAVGFLFGRNYFCRSFVTGLGVNPPLYPHHRPSTYDAIANPWPGYLVGGSPGNNTQDPVLSPTPSGLPAATYWADITGSYSSNEVAINWNSALVYALAGFIYETPTATPTITGTPPTSTITPTITETHTISPTFTVSSTPTITPTRNAVYVRITDHDSFPNPTDGSKITFRYTLEGYAEEADISIYTFGERKIRDIHETVIGPGVHTVEWVPEMKLANGLYYYSINAKNGTRPKAFHVGAFYVIRQVPNR